MDEEMRTIEVKKTEFSVIFWLGLLMIPVSIVFWIGYMKKIDIVNFDVYQMATEPDSINNADRQSRVIEIFNSTKFTFQYNGSSGLVSYDFAPSFYIIRRDNNYLMASILHAILFIKKGRRSYDNSYFNRTVTLPSSYKTFFFNITWTVPKTTSTVTQSFAYPVFRVIVDQEYPYSSTIHRLTRIKYYKVPAIENSDIKTQALIEEFVDYAPTSSLDVLMEIYDSEGNVNYTFPNLEEYTIAGLSVILCFISLIAVLVFLWHWWSVKYVIIQNVIRRCTTHQRYY